jgi:hypothetical protein
MKLPINKPYPTANIATRKQFLISAVRRLYEVMQDGEFRMIELTAEGFFKDKLVTENRGI